MINNVEDQPAISLVRDGPSSQALIFTWLLAAITVLGVYFGVFAPEASKGGGGPGQHSKGTPLWFNNQTTSPNTTRVIAWQAPAKDWEVWTAQRLKDYENECHRLLEDYSRLMETFEGELHGVAERLLHQRWQKDLQRIAQYARAQQTTLEQMLHERPLLYRLALPSSLSFTNQSTTKSRAQNSTTPITESTSQPLPHPVRLTPTSAPEASYEGMGQILAHLVRDWSDPGQPIRKSLYDWCKVRVPKTARHILVPGAGLGRLAWELTRSETAAPRVVHAVELSWTMVAVFAALVGQKVHRWTIYPYLNDFWTDQITCETRFRAVRIPNVHVTASHLSWTVADFVELAKLPAEAHAYDAVVTCFFLDTATNVLEYLHAMERVLVSGGRWINVGPLHWHANARIVLTAHDLYELFNALNQWKVVEWSVDTGPLEYRSVTTLGETTSTRYDAYRPLRFVVEKN